MSKSTIADGPASSSTPGDDLENKADPSQGVSSQPDSHAVPPDFSPKKIALIMTALCVCYPASALHGDQDAKVSNSWLCFLLLWMG